MTDISPAPIPSEERPSEEGEPIVNQESNVKDPPQPQLPRKTWANMSSSCASSDKEEKPQKVSLLSIMAEEEKNTKIVEEKQREEQVMNQAIQQSLLASQEDEELQLALRLSMAAMEQSTSVDASFEIPSVAAAAPSVAAAAAAPPEASAGGGLSPEELASIEQAIKAAEEEEAQKSLQLAMQLQLENVQQKQSASRNKVQGNVRVVTREEYLLEQQGLLLKKDHGDDLYNMYSADRLHLDHDQQQGYRINSQSSQSQWSKVDGSIILGPNNEIRTKHDPELQGQANAHRLQLDFDDEDGKPAARVGNKAYNSFQQKVKKKTVKGVASSGQGRANTDTEKTKEGALDGRVRLLVGKAINNDLIEKFNGCVKEGKEALVYHAEKGTESGGFDVAVKVFKRIQEFRNRRQYVDGDARYMSKDFAHKGSREQLEMWAEKEYRNLIRAHRSGVPVPKPLHQKENVLFMRFLGQEGWPCPQLRELKIKKGSKKWTALYEQTMMAVQTLYNESKLVHGDLSEYNILVCPSSLLDVESDDPEALQIALIDFGQAVEYKHPDAQELLRRDLSMIKNFFDKMGITTIALDAAMHYCQTKGAPLR